MNELQITSGGKTQTFQVGQIVRIGRSPDNNVVISDPTVSREHAFLVGTNEGWTFEDIAKDRTFVAGRPIRRLPVSGPTEFRLAAPDGPALLIQVGAAPAARHIEEPPKQRVPRVPEPEPVLQAAAVAARPPGRPAPGGRAADGLGAAINILVPVKSWLTDPGWRQWGRLAVIAFGLLPAVYTVVFVNATHFSTPGWAYSLYIAPLWAIAFWHLIRPGRLNALTVGTGVGIIAGVVILMKTLVMWWETAVNTNSGGPLTWIYGVGYPEEIAKALPVLVAAIVLRSRGKRLDVRMWMFLGTIAGLTFGVWESIEYVTSALSTAYQHPVTIIQEILAFCDRVFVDGFEHAVWAGISGFFIGIGVNYRRRGVPIVLFGVTLAAVLHGLNDWSTTTFTDQWIWIGVQLLSLLLFVGYTMSAATIQRQVRKTPMFRGNSMVFDPQSSMVGPTGT